MGAPKRIFCVLSSPLYVSQTRVISYKKNTPFVFTTKLADALIQKEIKIFQEEHLAKYTTVGGEVRSIELKNIKTMLNGYETANPLDQSAKELEMIIFISMSGEQILKKIENTIEKYFHFNQIKFSSFTMSFFTAVRDVFKQKDNFLLVDIGGEVTDISIPSTIYIAIDKDLADFFSETIKSEQFSQYTLAESKFEVVFLSTELLHGIATFKEPIIREPFLIIDSIYINRFLIET